MDQRPNEIAIPIVEAAADVLETPVKELPPLANSIDLDGLNMVVTTDSSHDITVTFSYAGLHIFVHSGGTIYVHPIHDEKVAVRREIQDEKKVDFNGDLE